MKRSGRSFRQNLADLRLKGDPTALRERASTQRVDLETYPVATLQKFGVGVPPLFSPDVVHARRVGVPAGITAFHSVAAPPGICLWVAASTRDQVFLSRHIEFVGSIARVSEAVDVEPGGAVAAKYALYLAPVAEVLAEAVSSVGFADDQPPYDQLFRLSAWNFVSWQPDGDGGRRAVPLAESEERRLRLRLERPTGQPVATSDQQRQNVDDLPVLSEWPSGAEVLSLLQAYVETTGRL